MKKKMNKKGFTLIELLAVIVVLAIVMVLATTTVLPLMTTARKNSFAMEAQSAIETATDLMSLIPLGTIKEADLTSKYGATNFKKVTSGSKTCYCFTLTTMVGESLYKLDSNQVSGSTPTYAGFVKVMTESGSNNHTYTVTMRNASYSVSKTAQRITGDDVQDYTGSLTTSGYTCSTMTSCS